MKAELELLALIRGQAGTEKKILFIVDLELIRIYIGEAGKGPGAREKKK